MNTYRYIRNIKIVNELINKGNDILEVTNHYKEPKILVFKFLNDSKFNEDFKVIVNERKGLK